MLKRATDMFVRSRDFAFLMGAQFAAQAGDGLVQAAIAKSIVFGGQKGFDLEGARSPDELLRIALYVFIPYTIISPFVGVVIDRWDRRRVLAVANGLRVPVLAAVVLVGTGDVGDLPLFLAFLLTLACTRAVLATKAAALPATVEADLLVEGNAISQVGGALFQLLAGGAALVAAGSLAAEPIVAAGAAIYLAGAVLAVRIGRAGTTPERGSLSEEVRRVLGRIVAGIREVAATSQAAAAITTYFWLRLLWSFSIVAISFVARELLADDDLQVLIITGGAGAVGAGLGFLLARYLHDRVKNTAKLVLAASAMAGTAVVALGALEIGVALGALMFFLGLGFFLGKISLDTLVQRALGDDFRGRAFALYDIAYNGAWVLAALAMKILWTEESQGILIAGMGAVFLVGLGALASWYRRAGLLAVTTDVTAALESEHATR